MMENNLGHVYNYFGDLSSKVKVTTPAKVTKSST